jgi:hypothetical protein
MNVEITKGSLKETIPRTDYDRSKQLERVEYFNTLGSIITNGARCTREINSRIAMAKEALNKTFSAPNCTIIYGRNQ